MREPPSREGELLAGKYKLERRLATGGMGEVYRAQNTAIGRPVAIKILLAEHAENETLVARFMTEARAANLVRHPNVVDVLDVGRADDGTPFLVQELLEGHDLGQHLRELGGRLSPAAVVKLMIPLVDAVSQAHAKGVVHRDLKPENVFLAKVGDDLVPKLLDFGISQVTPAEGSVRLTATGIAMGTPLYMSPEQVTSSKLVDARTDVWAFGVMLYELLTGELPFVAESAGAAFVKIATEEPPRLDELAPHVPDELCAIVERCLRKKRDDRYASAEELARALRDVLDAGVLGGASSARIAGVRVHSREASARTAEALRVELPTDPFAGLDLASSIRARAASPPVVPELELALPSTPAEPPAGASSSPNLSRPLSGGGYVELDPGDDGVGSGLQTVSYAPPPAAPPVRAPMPPRPARPGGVTPAGGDPRALLNGVILGAVVLGVGGLVTWLDPLAADWSLARWAATAEPDVDIGVAVAALVGAGVTGLVGTGRRPIQWGLVLTAMGLFAMAVLLGLQVLGGAEARGVAGSALPVAGAAAPLGVAIWGAGKGWGALRGEDATEKAAGLALAIVAGAACAVAVRIVRGG